MQHLKADTGVVVTVGPFVDVGDGFTPQIDIDITVANEAELLKHASSTVVSISGRTWTAVANCRGYYSLTLTAADTEDEGMLVVIVQDDSETLPVKQEYMVLAAASYDSLYTTNTGLMDINVKQINDVAAAAIQLSISAQTIVTGTVDNNVAEPTATVFDSNDITDAATDHYNGRIIIFTDNNLQNQATTIEGYTFLNPNSQFTVTALTAAPTVGSKFIIV